MMKVDFFLHEITNFLRTATIKNSYLADTVKQRTMLRLQVTELDDEDNPYYINVIGEYSQFDEVMTVASLDDETTIDFTKENLELHPKTKFAYSVGNKFYDDLEIRYPEQRDLIKSIRYPVDDMYTAINADNFKLLNYDGSQLEEFEVSSVINALQDHLRMISNRWYVKEYEYEELYPMIFWSSVWTSLPNVILNQRIDNLHTASVHSKYIWEYLTSKGLGDYRSILTREQQLFLYRNINYLIRNRGKDGTLSILSDNLLDYHNVTLNAKEIILNSENMLETAEPVAEIISRNIKDDITPSEVAEYGYETVEEIFIREHENGLEPILDNERIDDAENVLSNANTTWLPTKLLELNKTALNDEYLNLYISFAIETLLYKQSRNEIKYNVSVGLDTSINFSIQDVIALINYVSYRCYKQRITLTESTIDQFIDTEVIHNREKVTITTVNRDSFIGETVATIRPTLIPKFVQLTLPFKDTLDPDSMDLEFELDNNEYDLRRTFDIDALMNAIPTNVGNLVEPNSTLELVDEQFKVFQKMLNFIKASNDDYIHVSFDHLRKGMFVIDDVELNLEFTYDTYEEWFDSNSALRSIIDSLEYALDPELAYSKFADDLLLQVLPFNNSTAVKFSNFTSDNFKLMKQLFIQLCSYNITFLDTKLLDKTYLNFTPIVLQNDRYSVTQRHMLVNMDDLDLVVTDEVNRITIYDLEDGFSHHMDRIEIVNELDDPIEMCHGRQVNVTVNIDDELELMTGETIGVFGGQYNIGGHARYQQPSHQNNTLGFVNHDGRSIGTDFSGKHYIDFTQGGDLSSSGYVITDTEFLAGPRVAAIIESEYVADGVLSINMLDDISSVLESDLIITMSGRVTEPSVTVADLPDSVLAAFVPAFTDSVTTEMFGNEEVVTNVTNLITDNPDTSSITLNPVNGEIVKAPKTGVNSFKFASINTDDNANNPNNDALESSTPLPAMPTQIVSVLVTGIDQEVFSSVISFEDRLATNPTSDASQAMSWQLDQQTDGTWRVIYRDANGVFRKYKSDVSVESNEIQLLTVEFLPTGMSLYLNGSHLGSQTHPVVYDELLHGFQRGFFNLGINRSGNIYRAMDFYGVVIYDDPAEREDVEAWMRASAQVETVLTQVEDHHNVLDGQVISVLSITADDLELTMIDPDVSSKLMSEANGILDPLVYTDEVISELPDLIPPLEINYNAGDLNGNVEDLDPDDPDHHIEHDVISVLPCQSIVYCYGPLSVEDDDDFAIDLSGAGGFWTPW